MQRIPYTLDQATLICEKLQHLIGRPFDGNNSSIGNIECVAVSPFDQVNKKKFMLFYLLSDDAVKALNEEYRGLLYDVIIIARYTDNECELVQEDANSWLAKNNLSIGESINNLSLHNR